MFNITKVQARIGEKSISIETGQIARQAHGAVIVSCGETMVMVTAVAAPLRTSEEIDYFPLSVDYREKYSAAGKFPGGFIKREGRPSTKEILTSRMIDRPIRPLFPDGYFDEVQILVTVISADQENDPDILAMIGASAALHISKIPFLGPIGACRLSCVDDQFVIMPAYSQREKSDLNLVLCGTRQAINMIEVDSKEVSEELMARAVAHAQTCVVQVCELIEQLREKCGHPKEFTLADYDQQLEETLYNQVCDRLTSACRIPTKADRNSAVKQIFDPIFAQYCQPDGSGGSVCSTIMLRRILDNIQKKVVRDLLMEGIRPDGRALDQLRPIDCRVGVLPRSHGSSLFTRGETQALVSITLGTGQDEQTVDGLLEEYGQKFMLHYNFPPSSVGEVKPVRGPGRREIGHGALAEKALQQVIPSQEEFPYTIKIVSDITESNGSSSMASACGGSLALMDAGIPIKKPVAGISIGLVSSGDDYKLLTDIIGDEDHFGDMDFKVAGTERGITAVQLDIKATGLPHHIMIDALEKAHSARTKILDIMSAAIASPRQALSVYAPKITIIKIDPEYIGKVIGPGGKSIKGIQDQTNTKIEIEDDGTIYISCVGSDNHLIAREIIENMTSPPQVGKVYPNSKIVTIKEFGVFVEIIPGVDGLCHISEWGGEYVKNIEDVCRVGDVIPVKLLSIDDQGRLKLSRKAALVDLGLAVAEDPKPPRTNRPQKPR